MSRAAGSEAELRFVTLGGDEVLTPLENARADVVVTGRPVRTFAWYAGMKHYPGWWWSPTMGDLVGYESLLERDRLLIADFDCNVLAIASQPFGLTGRDGDALRRHVPDYLLGCRDGSVVVVDVKPAESLDDPKVADVLSWTGRLMARRGWRYEVWSGTDPVRLANVKFLGQGRRRDRVDSSSLSRLSAVGLPGMTLDSALMAATQGEGKPDRVDRAYLRAAMLALLWEQVWVVDLDVPLTGATVIEQVRGVGDDRRSA